MPARFSLAGDLLSSSLPEANDPSRAGVSEHPLRRAEREICRGVGPDRAFGLWPSRFTVMAATAKQGWHQW